MTFYGAKVEYALHTLLNLSLGPEGTAPSARDLADFQRLPLAFVRKMLTQLEKAGLIKGSEGVHGGWQLARDPREITVLEVADAAQGRQPLFACREIRARCALWPDDRPPPGATSGVCTIHAMMLSAERSMRRELAAHTLSEIVDQVRAKSPSWARGQVPGWFAERFATRRSSNSDE
jgi:Rrf2 family protein